MQHQYQSTVWGGLIGLIAIASLSFSQTAAAADGIKAAYVETVIPTKSFSGQVQVYSSQTIATLGPSQAGVFGIGSIIFTNSDTQAKTVIMGVPALGGAPCGTSSFSGYASPPFYIYVPAQSTLVMPFPTPYVVNPAGGQACLAIQSSGFAYYGGSIQVLVTGLIN